MVSCTLQFNHTTYAIHEFQSLPTPPTTTIPEVGSFKPHQALPSSTTPVTVGMMPAIEITSHISGQQVKTGPLTISGTSSDTSATNCQVYADWNDNMPFGKAVATGRGGPDDYSKWTFTYSSDYHLIQNGTNNLTSKISCVDGSTNLTKWHSINLIGMPDDLGITTGFPSTSPSPPSISPPMGLPLPAPSQAISPSPPLDPVFDVESTEEENDLVNLFDNSDEEDEEETQTSDEDEEDEEEDDDNDSRERCPDGTHRSPSGDCERVRDLPDLPRCPDGYHRSPGGHCEAVRD